MKNVGTKTIRIYVGKWLTWEHALRKARRERKRRAKHDHRGFTYHAMTGWATLT